MVVAILAGENAAVSGVYRELPDLEFLRRFRIFPGLRLNLSKSGVSTSIGGRGIAGSTRFTEEAIV